MNRLLTLFLAWTFVGSSWASCLEDVESSFKKLGPEVTPLSVWTDDLDDKNMYTQKLVNRIGLNTHFQGLVRLPGTSKFALSGGDMYSRRGHIFILDLESQNDREILEKNFHNKNTASASTDDKIIKSIIAGTDDAWHVGGMAVMENILAVPVENSVEGSSVIHFYDISDPGHLLKMDTVISRPLYKTGSVIIFRNQQNRIIVGANSDQKKLMEFYESLTSNIKDGFAQESRIVDMEANGQGATIVTQCDGKKFLIDFNNTSPIAPIIWGKDYVRLYSFDESNYKIELKAKRVFKTKRNCNFKASGSAYVTESGKLAIYGSHFYRHSKGARVKLCQFTEEN